MELLDRSTYYRAFQSHDARFDGRVFVGVTSTGIYCRPVCPARPPKFENCRFFASAAAAQDAGFRPCLRCRPEIAPDLPSWRGTASTVNRALHLISEGALDDDEAGCRDARRTAGCRRPSASPAVPASSRRLSRRRGADPARPVRQAASARHTPPDGPGRTGCRLWQRQALQRDLSRAVRTGHPARCAARMAAILRHATASH